MDTVRSLARLEWAEFADLLDGLQRHPRPAGREAGRVQHASTPLPMDFKHFCADGLNSQPLTFATA